MDHSHTLRLWKNRCVRTRMDLETHTIKYHIWKNNQKLLGTCTSIAVNYHRSYMGVSLNRSTLKSSISRWDFPWNKAFNYWGTPHCCKPPFSIIFQQTDETDFLCFSYGFSHPFTIFLWFSYGFSHLFTIFLWFSYGFSHPFHHDWWVASDPKVILVGGSTRIPAVQNLARETPPVTEAPGGDEKKHENLGCHGICHDISDHLMDHVYLFICIYIYIYIIYVYIYICIWDIFFDQFDLIWVHVWKNRLDIRLRLPFE